MAPAVLVSTTTTRVLMFKKLPLKLAWPCEVCSQEGVVQPLTKKSLWSCDRPKLLPLLRVAPKPEPLTTVSSNCSFAAFVGLDL